MTPSTRIAHVHISLALVYLVVALLSLVDFILAQFGLAPALGNLYWFRLHMITIGVLAQSVMGVLPLLLARQLRTAPPNPAAQWALLILLNLGLLLLSFGQVLWSQPLRSGAFRISSKPSDRRTRWHRIAATPQSIPPARAAAATLQSVGIGIGSDQERRWSAW